MLLARLQGEPVGRLAVGVDRDADQAARQLALEPASDRHVAGVRAAEAQWHPESLGGAHGNVGTDLTGWYEQGQT